MNKQELIETLEEIKANIDRNTEIGDRTIFSRGEKNAYNNAIGLAKQLDEPKKVVVPQFVANWLETCKENASLVECLQCQYFSASDDGDVYATEKVENWVFENDNDKLLANAWVNGYEVETEQFYYVCDPTTKQYLGVDKVSNEAFWLSSQNSGARTPLTEQEIKSIDERYWAFAVKVDGE